MTVLDLNLKLIKEKFPHSYEALQGLARKSSVYRPFQSEDGLGNMGIRMSEDTEEFLYDPSQTAMDTARWLHSINDHVSQQEHVLLYGLGFGHHLRLLLTYYPQKWIYLYEPDIDLLQTVIEFEDLTPLLSHPNVKALAVGRTTEAKRQLVYPICTHAQGSCAFLYMPFYARTTPKDIEALREEIPAIIEEFNINQNTLERFKNDWLENRLYHVSTNLVSQSLLSLKGKYADIPALITGSGPSLQEDIEHIRLLQQHCLIIAAGTSIQALLHHGIKPHFVVLVDGGEIVEKAFQNPATRSVPMLYSPTTNYRVTDKATNRLFHYFDHTDNVSRYYMGLTDEDPVFRSSASVTGMAIQAAVYMGCREIIFAGQDFSFPGGIYYAQGVNHFGESEHRYTVEKTANLLVDNVQGTQNRTTSSYHLLLRNTEELIAQLPNVRFINTSSVGAQIRGTEWIRMEQVCSELVGREVKAPGFLKATSNVEGAYCSERSAATVAKVMHLVDDILTYRQDLNDIKKLLSKVGEWSRTKPSKCANALETIEDKWSSVVNRDSFRALFESLLPRELHYFDSHLSLIIAEKTLMGKSKLFESYVGKIVDEMLGVIPQLEKIAGQAVQRVNKIFNSTE